MGAGGTTNLPTPDATGTIPMSATALKVILCNTTSAQSGAIPTGSQIIDAVAFGSGTNILETALAPVGSNTTSVIRNNSGYTDTNNNNSDFTAGAPNPRNSSNYATPISQATNISFGSVTSSSMTVSWTNGGGGNRAVFMKEGSGTITNPTNNTTLTANSNWSGTKGTQLGISGYYCIYVGTGSSVPLTNLGSGKTYYFQVFEFNGTANGSTSSYMTSTATNNPNSQATSAGLIPSLSVSSLTGFGSKCINSINGPNMFTISGSNLSLANVTVGGLTGYTYSTTSGGSYTASLDLTQSGGTYSQDVYVKFSPTAAQSYDGNISVGGGGASSINCAASGTGVNAAPTLTTTTPAASITTTTVTSSGNVSDAGCQAITARGICYGASLNPDITGTKTTETGTTGVVTSNITGLSPNTLYHFRAYATSSAGTSYGSDVTFTTLNLSTPNATAATSKTSSGFTANWDAVDGATGYDVNVYTKTAGATASDLFISEYGEGISNNRYIEIFNGTGIPVDLSKYSLKQAVDGGGWDVDITYTLPLTGTLANNQVFVVAASTANATILSKANLTIAYSATVQGGRFPYFTGNDAIGLFKNGVIIDVFGNPASNATITVAGSANGQDKTMVRKSTVNSGNTNWTISSGTNTTDSEWEIYAIDTWTYLGSHTMAGGSTTTPISGSPFTVSGTTNKVLSSLSSGTAYYYTVVAKNGATSSASSNEITAITDIDGTLNSSAIADCPTCDVSVAATGTLNVDASKTYNSITVAPGGKLTLADGNTLTAPITLQSSSSGTGTYVDSNTGTGLPAITASVEQYLPQGRNWYVGIPVSETNLPYSTLTAAGASSVSHWSEATGAWIDGYTGTLTAGKGYIAVSPSGTNTNNISFSGTLNTGNVPVNVTRTVGKTKEGFNLIANPYPSYLNPCALITASGKLETTIWYRTKASSYIFETVNTASGEGTGGVTGYIPPMQAFWVRVLPNTDPLVDNSATLTFTNAMRYHANPTGVTTTVMKAPSVVQNKMLRLQITNGLNTDETLLYTNENASTNLDIYDSKKFSNDNAAIPEIYTLAGNEQLVINGMNTLPLDTEIPLGFMTKTAGTFSLKASEITNFDPTIQVILKDKQNISQPEQELTVGNAYTFSSDVVNTSSRFSIIFKSTDVNAGLNTNEMKQIVISKNANNQITVNCTGNLTNESFVTVYNAIGQKLVVKQLKSNRSVVSVPTNATGVFVVTVNNAGEKITRKVILN